VAHRHHRDAIFGGNHLDILIFVHFLGGLGDMLFLGMGKLDEI